MTTWKLHQQAVLFLNSTHTHNHRLLYILGQSLLDHIMDAYSHWIEVLPTHSATSVTTIKLLRLVFAMHDLPKITVGNNRPCFASDKFIVCLKNGIRHLKTAPPGFKWFGEIGRTDSKTRASKAKGQGHPLSASKVSVKLSSNTLVNNK